VTGALRVVEAGWSTTMQDLGRVGYAHLGVPHAGAVDLASHALANRLVGNPRDAATLESAGGLVVEAVGAVVAATSGDGSRHTLRSGDRLRLDPPSGVVWTYLAVRGGYVTDPVLGSRSHDTLSGIGPPAVRQGAVLQVGHDPHTELVADLAPIRPTSSVVRLWPGPRAGWFRRGLETLVERAWTVGNDVSRVGVRLDAATFDRTADMPHHMASEGLVVGAIEITPAGEPIVMLANHPTTGGYPVVAVVEPDDIGIVAQAGPGTTIRFRHAQMGLG
jgi:biotin-dependent carboxylase-like uncharacterized protein